MTSDASVELDAADLVDGVARLFVAAGLSPGAARTVASALVDADLDGVGSHGVMMVDMYLDRLRRGSVSTREKAEVVTDNGAVAVLDARHAFGHLTGDQAIALAVDKAKRFGAGVVAVRHAFHFGVARRYAVAAADAGCIGIVMCNTRPLMPAPGGAERVVGNNPLAVALPVDGPPLALDMAMSEAAMGKIRLAANGGGTIPPTWATRADGTPTTDPREAIAGMLLPAAGPKGFGLAMMIDLMAGLLSGGAWGEAVRPLYGDMAEPYDCAHLFIAIDIGHFVDPAHFRREATRAAERVRASARAPGVAELFTPGEIEWRRREASRGRVRVAGEAVRRLERLAGELGVAATVFAAHAGA